MISDTLMSQFALNFFVLKRNTAGISQEECLRSPQEGGNCVNWVLGHILATRNSLLELLEEEPVWSEEQALRYRRGSPPVTAGTEAIPLARMLTDLEESQSRIESGVKRLDSARLSEAAPFSPTGRADETVGSLIATLSFHESYHAGQTGLLRHILGKGDRI